MLDVGHKSVHTNIEVFGLIRLGIAPEFTVLIEDTLKYIFETKGWPKSAVYAKDRIEVVLELSLKMLRSWSDFPYFVVFCRILRKPLFM